jgi:hypothetical protein
MDSEKPSIRVEQSLYQISNEGVEFRRYSARYDDPNDYPSTTLEQGASREEALEKLYRALELKGFDRATLPKPRHVH